MVAWRKLLIPIIPLLFLIGVLAYGLTKDPKEIASPLVGREAPDFTIDLFDAGRLSLSDTRGKVVVVNFWASWCIPCREESHILEGAWQSYKDKGVAFIGVNIQDRERDARAFLKRFRKSYPNGPDPDGKISIDYGIYGVPETFFIDRQGRVAYKHVGGVTARLLRDKIEELLMGLGPTP